jgi:hypothetical protein
VQPTPQQALDWLRTCTDDEGTTVLALLMVGSEEASRSFIENHDGLKAEVGALRKALATEWERGYDAGVEYAKERALEVLRDH